MTSTDPIVRKQLVHKRLTDALHATRQLERALAGLALLGPDALEAAATNPAVADRMAALSAELMALRSEDNEADMLAGFLSLLTREDNR